jgi:hypothetical protein
VPDIGMARRKGLKLGLHGGNLLVERHEEYMDERGNKSYGKNSGGRNCIFARAKLCGVTKKSAS